PSFSAARTIAIAARSLTDPVGLWSSSFAQIRTGFGPCHRRDSRRNPTSGVSPTASSSESNRAMSASGDGREDRHGVTILQYGVERPREPHVLVVDVDVDE